MFLPRSLVMIQWFRLFVHNGNRNTDRYFIDIKKNLISHKNDRIVQVYMKDG